jgi:hypothetical protein
MNFNYVTSIETSYWEWDGFWQFLDETRSGP